MATLGHMGAAPKTTQGLPSWGCGHVCAQGRGDILSSRVRQKRFANIDKFQSLSLEDPSLISKIKCRDVGIQLNPPNPFPNIYFPFISSSRNLSFLTVIQEHQLSLFRQCVALVGLEKKNIRRSSCLLEQPTLSARPLIIFSSVNRGTDKVCFK